VHRKYYLFTLILSGVITGITLGSCTTAAADQPNPIIAAADTTPTWIQRFTANPAFIADGFDFPVGPPDAKGYYNAQPMGRNLHLGDDWNGVGGGNTDMGDPVYSIAHGYVTQALDEGGGWDNVVRIVHVYNENGKQKAVESLYAHLDTMLVKEGQWIKRGQQLGTIGNAHGLYYAHLHLEIRDSVGMFIGGGYSHDTKGYLAPTPFIKAHRP
jgi:murein DD-endopeptidase MepM/ murein hydrolase activator NlpD